VDSFFQAVAVIGREGRQRRVPPAELVRDKSLQRADGERLIDGSAPASNFTWRSADAPANAGQRIGAAGDHVRPPIVARGYGADVTPGIRMHRAAELALDLLPPIFLIGNLDLEARRHGKFHGLTNQ